MSQLVLQLPPYLEDLDPERVRQLLGVSLDLDVEGQDDRVLLFVLQHHGSLHHVSLDNGTDLDSGILRKKSE